MLPELAGAACGALLSIAVSVARTPNPARIPAHRLAFRAASGITVWWILSTLAAWAIGCLLNLLFASSLIDARARFLASLVSGVVTAQFGWIKDWVIPYSPDRRISRFFRGLQTLDEFTRLYLKRIIAYEERKINYEFFAVDGDLELPGRQEAVRRLFDFHQVEIALAYRRQLHDWEAEKVLAVFNLGVPNRDIKFKLLLRFLGYERTLEVLEALVRQPDLLRLNGDHQVVRSLESSYVRDYVLQREVRL